MTATAALLQEEAAGVRLIRRPGRAGAMPRGRAGAMPIVLLHGIGSNAASWNRLMSATPSGAPMIAWNAPGYGGSSPVAQAQPTPDAYADRLEAVLSALGLNRILLIGHSLGCLFAARFAATRPSVVAGIALLSPALGYRTRPGLPLPPAVQARTDELQAMGGQAFAAKRADRLVYRPEDKIEVAAAVRQAMASVDPAGYAQAVRALGAGDLLADAGVLSMPVLVATGAQDVVTPPSNAAALFAALPAAARSALTPHGPAIIEDAGHALPQEQPRQLADLIHRFSGSLS